MLRWGRCASVGTLGTMVQSTQPLSRNHLYQIHRGMLSLGDAVVTTNLATRREGRRVAKSIGRATATSGTLGLLTDAHRPCGSPVASTGRRAASRGPRLL